MTSDELVTAAKAARDRAYAPYSKFRVGAALLTEDGQVFTGVNVENISYGLTMCAERVAVGRAIDAGITAFARLAVVADSRVSIMPCGACRQVLAEFNPSLEIVSANLDGETQTLNLQELLPRSRQGILE